MSEFEVFIVHACFCVVVGLVSGLVTGALVPGGWWPGFMGGVLISGLLVRFMQQVDDE